MIRKNESSIKKPQRALQF